MRKKYISPVCDIYEFKNEDILTASTISEDPDTNVNLANNWVQAQAKNISGGTYAGDLSFFD